VYFGRVKLKMSLCLISYALCHEGILGIATPFLTLALGGGEWSASGPCCFTPGEPAPGTHWIGGYVGPRVSLDAVGNRKFLHCQELNPSCSASSPSLYHELSRLPVYFCKCHNVLKESTATIICPEDGGSMFLQNVGAYLQK
jgi:hypothetical protein